MEQGVVSVVSVQQILLAMAGNPALLPEHADALIAIGDPDVLLEVAREQHLSLAQTDRLAGYGQRELALALVQAGNLPVERIPRDDPWAMLAGIGRADAPDEWLSLLASWPDPAVRRALGVHATERSDIAVLVADDADCSVAACAAQLYELPNELGGRLAQRAESCVRVALGSNLHVSAATLAELITDGGRPPMRPCPHWPDLALALREVRTRVAGNPSTPLDAVVPFVTEPDPAMALALARRSDLPDGVYDSLVAMRDPQITIRVAMNWAVPAGLLRRLYDDDAGRWRQAVLANPRTPLDLLIRHSRARGVPSTDYHPDLETLRALATDTDPRVRLVAAASRRIPPNLRAALINDSDIDVVQRAVCDVSVSPEQVRATAARHGLQLFPYLAGHPCCPPDILFVIATHPDSPIGAILDVAIHEASPPAALAACLRRPQAVAYVAGNPAAPPDMLSELAAHPDPEVVLEVARNPSLPHAAGHRVLQHLAATTRQQEPEP
ncbi:hypothetical protein [Dactylosporangium sp. NPDC048998]|uniref:hypothetical protein n=1 Tax=Dactylosporangium sp. NPDC048998 TaxID=3363976 RepID=UPI0037176F41